MVHREREREGINEDGISLREEGKGQRGRCKGQIEREMMIEKRIEGERMRTREIESETE